jgi:hypothetical protein
MSTASATATLRTTTETTAPTGIVAALLKLISSTAKPKAAAQDDSWTYGARGL